MCKRRTSRGTRKAAPLANTASVLANRFHVRPANGESDAEAGGETSCTVSGPRVLWEPGAMKARRRPRRGLQFTCAWRTASRTLTQARRRGGAPATTPARASRRRSMPSAWHFLYKLAALQAERLRRVRHALIVLLQLGEDLLALEGVGALRQRAARWCGMRRRRRALRLRQRQLHRGRIHRAIGQQQQPLDHVAQLPHIARPGVALQFPDRVRARTASAFQPFCSATCAAKCATSAGMSSARSRSAGRTSGKT